MRAGVTRPHLQAALPFTVGNCAILLLSAMDAFMKELTLSIGAYNALLWRSFISIAISGALFAAHRSPLPSRHAFALHVRRGAITTAMALLFFWGIGRVPLAEAIALCFVAPLLALYLAAVLLGERVGGRAIAGSALAFAGVLVMVVARARTPGESASLVGAVAILGSAGLYAYNIILMRRQALAAKPVEIAFFQSIVVGGLLLPAAPFLAIVPSPGAAPAMLASSLLSLGGMLLFAWAYARGEAQHLAPTEYTGIVWAALFGWWAFGEAVNASTVVGATLIVAGCIHAARPRPGPAVQAA